MVENEPTLDVVDPHDGIGPSCRVVGQNRLERLHRRHRLPVGGQIVVRQRPGPPEAHLAIRRGPPHSTPATSRANRSITSTPYPRWVRSPHGSRNGAL